MKIHNMHKPFAMIREFQLSINYAAITPDDLIIWY
jgi:hypothetical protein